MFCVHGFVHSPSSASICVFETITAHCCGSAMRFRLLGLGLLVRGALGGFAPPPGPPALRGRGRGAAVRSVEVALHWGSGRAIGETETDRPGTCHSGAIAVLLAVVSHADVTPWSGATGTAVCGKTWIIRRGSRSADRLLLRQRHLAGLDRRSACGGAGPASC